MRIPTITFACAAALLVCGHGLAETTESVPGNQVTDSSIAKLEMSVAASPDNAALHAELSRAYASVGRAARALTEINSAIGIDSNNVSYHESRIQLANWAGDTALAVDSSRRILTLDPNNAGAPLINARLLKWEGKLEASARAYRGYLRTHADNLSAVIELAQVECWIPPHSGDGPVRAAPQPQSP